MAHVLITGGAGFIGYHLANRLASQGYKITIVDNFFRGEKDDMLISLLSLPNVSFIEADLTKPDAWEQIGGGFDYVYHLVGINGTKLFYEIPHEVLRIGISTTMNVLEWFQSKNKKPDAKILYTSSNEAYAGAFEAFGSLLLPTPERVPLVVADTYNPRWSYGAQKMIGELFFIHYAKAYSFRMSIVRPHNFYGPRSGFDHVIPESLRRIANKEEPFNIFGADSTRSFCYIDDAVEAMHMVMESKKTDNGTYHIGTKVETPIRNLIELLFRISDWHPRETIIKASPPGSVIRRLPDVSKIKNDTGWEAKTSLEEGLKITVPWYLKNAQ